MLKSFDFITLSWILCSGGFYGPFYSLAILARQWYNDFQLLDIALFKFMFPICVPTLIEMWIVYLIIQKNLYNDNLQILADPVVKSLFYDFKNMISISINMIEQVNWINNVWQVNWINLVWLSPHQSPPKRTIHLGSYRYNHKTDGPGTVCYSALAKYASVTYCWEISFSKHHQSRLIFISSLIFEDVQVIVVIFIKRCCCFDLLTVTVTQFIESK